MNIIARLILKSPLRVLYHGPVGREFIEFNNHYLVARKSIEGATIVRDKMNFSYFFGINRSIDLIIKQDRIKNVGKSVILPNPLLFFSWKKIVIEKSNPHFIIEFFDIPNDGIMPLSYFDSHLISADKEDETKKRINFLISNMYLVEKKASELGDISLYRSKDHRLWQLWSDQNNHLHLENITQQQWSFDFIEARESKKNFTTQNSTELNKFDKEYFEALDEDPRRRKCQEEGCNNICAKGSTLCKKHHFEIITGKKI